MKWNIEIGIAAIALSVWSPAEAFAATSYSKSASSANGIGDDTFGADYYVGASIDATYSSGILFGTDGKAYADVTVFGITMRPAEVSAYGDLDAAGSSVSAKFGATMKVLGSTIYNKSGSNTASLTWNFDKRYDKSFFDASENFTVAGIPVTVSASLDGHLGLDIYLAGNVSTKSLSGTVKPYLRADATVSAGVGVSGCAAEANGSVRIIDLAVPFTPWLVGNTSNSSCSKRASVSMLLSGDLEISTLDGRVWVELACTGISAEAEIADWTGYSWDFGLVNYSSGTVCIG